MHSLNENSLIKVALSLFLALLILGSCKKLVDIDAPLTSINVENAYQSDATAIAVLTGIYTNMMNVYNGTFSGNNGNGSISLCAGLSADEFTLWSGVSATDARFHYFTNALSVSASNPFGSDFWNLFNQNYILACNTAIEGLTASNALTPAVKQQLLGEAKFLRSFYYFYLVNLFGDVPLVTSTNWQTNATLARAPTAQVYQQMINDLTDAKNLLSADYLDANLQIYNGVAERVRPTKAAAAALLARVYLYKEDYQNAAVEATEIINNSALYGLVGLDNVFLKNSKEAIWQLQPTTSGYNTQDAVAFVIPLTGPDPYYNPVYLSDTLLKSFEVNDQRKLSWVGSITSAGTTYFYPYKYKVNIPDPNITSTDAITEYLMVLRLGEQYLIRAESRAQQNDIGGAQSDLNMIRSRAGLGPTTANDKPSLLSAILHERQVELFTEWGHRWLDLKRTGNVDAVMSVVTPLKANGALWKSYQQLYPLPFADIQKDGNLVQNPGY